ncbi:MAG TPA: endonuclease MutS2 [Geothermobacteraceae bacterium]|nr:endonuclease MutS2 [Geothermobacteraceae bacterium]
MIAESYRILEFDKVRELLADQALTGFGRARVQELAPLASDAAVRESLQAVSEMRRLVERYGRPPLGALHDLRELIGKLRAEGAWLLPEKLLQVLETLEATRECRAFFDKAEAPGIQQQAGELMLLQPLARELRESIGPRGEILDSASFELGDLRREIRTTRERIKKILERLLHDEQLAPAFQEQLITDRNGRYVLPVRADRRSQVKGFVHDESASGQTLYVEPAQTLEQNNELRSLQREEQREEERILLRLAAAVRQQGPILLDNQQRLAEFDYLHAAARFSLLVAGVAPQVSQQPGFAIREARHPLLLFDKTGQPTQQAIPIDLQLADQVRTLIISGPNTGGKTVALKTVGLLHLLVASGLHVPCHPDSRFCLYRKVLADIGDEQSIEESLSTFSGHLLHLRSILQLADAQSLVLLDEIGTGTDPHEGGALAMALLDELQAAGAVTVATTHLNVVKGYALLHDGVENAAVEFDSRTNAPTYRLHYGIPGGSGALAIARRMEFPEAVLQRADRYRGEDEQAGGSVIEELNRLSRELAAERDSASQARHEARQLAKRRDELLQQAGAERAALLNQARGEAEQLVARTERQLKQLLKRLDTQPPGTAQQAAATGELRQLRSELQPEGPPLQKQAATELKTGELVRFLPLNTEAEVVRIDGRQVELNLGGKKLRCRRDDLRGYQPRRFRQAGQSVTRVRNRKLESDFQPKLLLVGARVDDALPQLERFIDDALLHQQRQVEVVHGAGEGILRRAVRDFLAANRAVTAFHAGDVAQGGDNVTIVELGD